MTYQYRLTGIPDGREDSLLWSLQMKQMPSRQSKCSMDMNCKGEHSELTLQKNNSSDHVASAIPAHPVVAVLEVPAVPNLKGVVVIFGLKNVDIDTVKHSKSPDLQS